MEKKEITTRFDFIDQDKRIIDQRVRKHKLSLTEHQKILKAASDDKDLADELVVCRDMEVVQ